MQGPAGQAVPLTAGVASRWGAIVGEVVLSKVLILGGTEEARQLADALVGMGHEVITSLAGKTSDPLLPKGEMRMGGFGGADGLARYLKAEGIERLVDATHPFAVEMSANAAWAAKETGVQLVRLVRPPWAEPHYAFWQHVGSSEDAAAALPPGARVMLTVGHKDLSVFLDRTDCAFVVRSIEPLNAELPEHAVAITGRPPFYVGAETELLRSYGITHLVTKNSGGVQTEAKLQAAQQLRATVLMIARPERAAAKEAPTVGRAIAALKL